MQHLILYKRYWLIPLAFWTLLVIVSLIWNLDVARHHAHELAVERGRFIFQMVETFRLWNARHGGVYALITEDNKPNPYLEVEEREIVSAAGRRFTMLNPAYMTRQLSEVIREKNGFIMRITSLNPINPTNKALPWEATALSLFERDRQVKEWSGVIGSGAARTFRYIGALETKEACLKCHEKQGYKLGDIRGGISVSFPAAPFLESERAHIQNSLLLHAIVWLLLIGLTLFAQIRFRRQMLSLIETKNNQELLVEKRTQELHEEMQERRQAEAQLRLFIESSAEAILVIDEEGRCRLCNPVALQLLGYRNEAEILGRKAHELLRGPDEVGVAEDECDIYKAYHEGTVIHVEDATFVCADGSSFPVEFRSSPIIEGSEVLGAVVTFSDITQRKALEAEHWRQANFDSLTGLVNRSLFFERLNQFIATSARYGHHFALLFIDLDGFKEVNDTLGHDSGDVLLTEAAQRLSECVRDADTVARLGGDEFTVILSEIAAREDVERVAQMIIERIASPFMIKGGTVHISASIGIALYPDDNDSGEGLLNNADAAMYQSKKAGKNRFTFFTSES